MISRKEQILSVLRDLKPHTCAQIATKLGTSSKLLSSHLNSISKRGVVFCLEGVRRQRPNYYSLQPITTRDVPGISVYIAPDKLQCRDCGGIFPRSPEYFFRRSADVRHVGTPREFNARCKSCASAVAARQRRERLADITANEVRRIKYELKKAERDAERAAERRLRSPDGKEPAWIKQTTGNTTRVFVQDGWKPHRDADVSRTTPGLLGYASALARIDV